MAADRTSVINQHEDRRFEEGEELLQVAQCNLGIVLPALMCARSLFLFAPSDGGDAQRESFPERNRRLHDGATSPTQPQDPPSCSNPRRDTDPPTVQPPANQLPAAGRPGPRHEGISHKHFVQLVRCRTSIGKWPVLWYKIQNMLNILVLDLVHLTQTISRLKHSGDHF